MTLRRPRVLVFDIDDTLYLERDYVSSGFCAVDQWARVHLNAPGFGGACRRLFAEGARGNIFDLALKELGIGAGGEAVAEMVECYRSHRPAIALLEDARRFLGENRAGYHFAALSDGPLAAQSNKARALGLEAWMEQLVLTDAWGRAYWKPHARGFLEVQSFFGVQGGECLYVANNPVKDFTAPNQLGWQAVRIRRPDGLHAGEETPAAISLQAEIDDFGDLARRLGSC